MAQAGASSQAGGAQQAAAGLRRFGAHSGAVGKMGERGFGQSQGPQSTSAFMELSEEQRDEVNEAFALFDLDKDNHLTYHELKVALKALGFTLSKPDLLSLLEKYSTTHGAPSIHPSRQRLSHDAFRAIAAQQILARDPREEILRAFELFDEGQKGRITVQDLRRVARELGESLEDGELEAMIEEFDLDGDGGIGREEFIGICLQP